LIPLSPSILTVSLPPALLKEALFNLERSKGKEQALKYFENDFYGFGKKNMVE